MKKALALILSLVMCVGLFAGCGQQNDANNDGNQGQGSTAKTLVVGTQNFDGKFSPFFYTNDYENQVMSMVFDPLLGTDREGSVVLKGIEGDVRPYNGTDYTYYGVADCEIVEKEDGTVDYNITLKPGVKFSDGTEMTIDDVIFSYYVLLDPTYDGVSTLYSIPIKGLDAYRSGMDSRMNLILAAGPDGYTATDFFTEDQYNTFWAAFNAAGVKFTQEILDYVVAAGSATASDSVAAQAANWGYELAEGATVEDFWKAIVAKYGYDISDNGINAETAGTSISAFIEAEIGDAFSDYTVGVQTGESAPNVSGIVKTGDYRMTVTLTEVNATAIYQIPVTICPMHYYGETEKYDYDNNKFGFDKGDLSHVRSVTTQPMGAGPYKFVKFENGTVNFEANDSYYLGAPKIKHVNFLESQETDKLNGVVTGTIDITDPSFSADTVNAIQQQNSNGELNGDKITVNTVDNLGYGYMGISSVAVNVGGDPGSDASKNLRKGLATVFAAYRELSVESYYGERASVINYPISNTSWAAPQASDPGYKVAFSVDADGKDIYTSDMTADQKYEAALQAALGFFEKAGCKVENGKVVTNPAGGKDTDAYAIEREALIPADGKGDHPSFMILTEASKALEKIGVHLIVTDLSDSTQLWDTIEADQADMFAAAWGATVDPDMYQIYFSGMDGKAAGGSNYMYDINDAELNKLILDARASLDQSYRKTMYKACLDIIVDWAVEVPVYQRQNAVIFSTERVNMETVTPDITTFYGWLSEIQNVELN